jgi:replicative DNA helicase
MSTVLTHDLTSEAFWQEFNLRQMLPPDAVPTHLNSLNAICRDDGGGIGFAHGWFVTVGGNPGFGKSAMALNLASAALRNGEHVGYISLEMSRWQLAARFYAIHSGTPIAHLERGSYSPTIAAQARDRIAALPPYYVPNEITGDWTAIVDFVRECYEKGCRWFVLDYLQLVQIGDEESINRAMTSIVTDLRAWGVNNESTIVNLSQFNRQTSGEYGVRPRPQGLWGGMILEAASDMVLLLDHSRYVRTGNEAKTWLLAAKNKHGPTGEIPIWWDYKNLQMHEALDDEVAEWPEKSGPHSR